MMMLRAIIYSWIGTVALIWAGALIVHMNERVSIMFDPETDGPIRFEQTYRMPSMPQVGTACATTISSGSGTSMMSVMVPCVITTSASTGVWVSSSTGGQPQ